VGTPLLSPTSQPWTSGAGKPYWQLPHNSPATPGEQASVRVLGNANDIWKTYDGFIWTLVSSGQTFAGTRCFPVGDLTGIMYAFTGTDAATHYASTNGGQTWTWLSSGGSVAQRDIMSCETVPGTDDYLMLGQLEAILSFTHCCRFVC
jgi:hypothetical protein